MSSAKAKPEPAAPTGRKLSTAAGMVATAAAFVLGVAMAIRPIATNDIGYHLAYGEHFLHTGRIVQTNRFIYTRFDREILSDPENLGPGCRYDPETNTYRFVNANWLSQVIMAAVGWAGGFHGLVALQAVLVAGIFAVLIVAMRRRQVAWQWIAPALLLVAMVSYERFNLKPELFGYLVLATQLCLLVEPGFSWRRAVAVIALQLLAVNLHSYFLLGAAVTGAIFLDALLRWLWRRTVTQADAADIAGRLKWLGVAAAGVLLAALCNPWFARGAVMPVQTLLYLSQHHIAGSEPHPGDFHPWETIAELQSPFGKRYQDNRAFVACVVLLGVSGAAALASLLRRRWGWLLVLAGMTAVSLSTRRNIGPAAMVLAPLAMIGLTDGWGRLRGKLSGGHARPALKAWERRLSRLDRPAAVAAGAVVAALSAWWTWGVVTQRFYTSERRTIRFGTGLLRSAVPLDEARWIDTHKPQGRAFCDFGTSSNLMYFTRPHREVPLLTNTWACPPYVMKQTILWGQGREGFEAFATEYDVGVVVLRQLLTNRRLMEKLAGSPDWAVVHLGAHYVVFLRRSGSNAALARQAEITQQNFQLGPFIQQVLASDPASGFSLHSGGLLLRRLGWKDHALSVWRRCAELPEPYPDSLWSLGASLLARAAAKARDMSGYLGRGMSQEAEHARRGALEDLAEARQALRRALKLNPRLRQASEDLQRVEQALAALEATGPSSRESR